MHLKIYLCYQRLQFVGSNRRPTICRQSDDELSSFKRITFVKRDSYDLSTSYIVLVHSSGTRHYTHDLWPTAGAASSVSCPHLSTAIILLLRHEAMASDVAGKDASTWSSRNPPQT